MAMIKPKRNYPILSRHRGPKKPYDGEARKDIAPTSTPIYYIEREYSEYEIANFGKTISVNTTLTRDTGYRKVKTFLPRKDWKVLVAKGSDATNAYTRFGQSFKDLQYNCYVTGKDTFNRSVKSYGYGNRTGGDLQDNKDDSALVGLASSSLKRKLNGNIGKAQLMAPLAESREIHRLVRQINTLGMDTLKALLAIRKSRGKSAVKLFADVWLGFGFGVNPLLHDIESAANAILDYTTRDDRRVRITGTANRDWSSSTFFNPRSAAYGVQWWIHASARHVQGARIVAGVDLKLRSASSYSVTDHLGLKISDVPSTLWELTPFSWVADYFVTVGPWLEDRFFTLPGTVKYISLSRKYEADVKFTGRYSYDKTLLSVSGSPGTGWLKTFYFDRSSLTALPYRQVEVKSLDEVAKYGITKLLNLASVLAGSRLRS